MSKKISQFTDLTSVDLSNNDIIPILDISESIPANRNKKISILDLHASLAPKVNPTFTGTVVIPTPPVNNSSTLAATTQYVQTELQDLSLDDLTNVSGATSNTVNNKVLTYNSTNSQYEPKFPTSVRTLTLTTNNTNISADENTYLFLDPNGSNRTVILPLGQEGLRYIISNLNTNFIITVSASSPNLIDLSLYDDGGVGPTTVSSYALDQVSELVFSNNKWFFISQSYSTGGSSIGTINKGDLLTGNLGNPAIHPSGADNLYLKSNSTLATGLEWSTINLNTITSPTINYSFNNVRITNLASPVSANDAVNKSYADSISSGVDPKESCTAATTTTLAATTSSVWTYSGSGATKTITSPITSVTVDGVTLVVNDRLLVKDEAAGQHNGIYTVTQLSPSTILTRASDFNNVVNITSGAYTLIVNGTTNSAKGFILITNGAITVESTNLIFTQFSGGSSGVTTFDALTDVNVGTPGAPENGQLVGWDNATSQFTLKERPGTAIGDLVKLQNVSGNPGLPAVDGSLLTNLPTGLISPLTTTGDLLTRNLTTHTRQPIGQQGQRLSVNFVDSTSLRWESKWSAEDVLYSKEFARVSSTETPTSYEIIRYIGTNELPLGTYTNVATSGKVIVTTNSTAGSGLNDPTVLTDNSVGTAFSLNNSEFVKWQFVDYKIQPYLILLHDNSNVAGDTVFNVEVSNDNTNWTFIDIITLVGPTSTLPWRTSYTDISAFYSYLRITRDGGASTGTNEFAEIKLYGYVKNNTSQGHVFAYDATRQKLVPIKASANNLVLTSDSAEDSGVKWAAAGSSTPSNKIPTNEQTLSANKTLLNTDVSIQVLNPGGANRDVVLPISPQTDLYFKIINTDPANFNLNIKETAGGSAVIILNSSTPFVECHRTATQWIILS